MSSSLFLDPQVSLTLPEAFDFEGYIDTERELWAFFPETCGKRVNFCQLGLTAWLYAEVADDHAPLRADETYFLMPCEDGQMRPVRMRSERTLTLEEFRMTHLTSIRMMEKLWPTGRLMNEVHRRILGAEIATESTSQH